MLRNRKSSSMASVFTFAVGSVAGPGIGGDNPAQSVVEAWLANSTARFTETGFDNLTCNATASFQDTIT